MMRREWTDTIPDWTGRGNGKRCYKFVFGARTASAVHWPNHDQQMHNPIG